MPGHPAETKNIVQFVRDVHSLKHPRQWSSELFTRAFRGALRFQPELKSLPTRVLILSNSESGFELARFLKKRTMGLRTERATAILDLPACGSEYLKGRYRERVRTNISKANSLGLSCRALRSDEFQALVERLSEDGSNIPYLELLLAEPARPDMEHWVGVDEGGEAIALARVQTDGDVAWLKCLVAIADDPRSVIRYKLSAEMFMSLADRQYKTVVAGSVVDLSDGLAFFQHLLGFRATQVEIQHQRFVRRMSSEALARKFNLSQTKESIGSH